ncbi:substrate-binding periplasmic protein [Undibacterium rugosum]|uniref:Transporter substrate-binding domain-containing protein n=1 Tax=Undibacterium rugosum TaxID=2762291 RepID=A0A923I377_9BURK|nr:ABC transporter substrate-binding protein [Undibacterium rugosum]MBC3936938.1 transporter substrate-binding domain-containing protein [Undibacterium rugosum]MBR7779454.1 transporter substrate-binding domain-containing protein [Undibacterium rugosum]
MRKLTVMGFFCLFFMGSCFAAQGNSLVITTENYPPFNIVDPKNQEISGISTDKVRELMRRAGETITIKAYPWSRAFKMGQEDLDTCVYSTTRTAEREALFKWVGPLVKNNWYFFARADDERQIKSLESMHSYVVGTYHDDAVEKYLASNGFKTDPANYDGENPKKLIAKRIDFWATGELLGLYILKEQGMTQSVKPLFKFNQTEMYLACNLKIDQKRIDNMNKVLQAMEKDGTNLAIERKYK